MSAAERRTILLVDDSADDRAAIRRLLARHSREYVVLEAETGDAGLALARAECPDCVLLDFYLPDMQGHEFLDALKQPGHVELPLAVAVLTGQENDQVAVESLKRGAQDYLVKDALTGPALVRAVENCIEKFRIQRELIESRLAVELRNQKLEVLRDQLQQKVQELNEATRAKEQFLAVMSHEMRTPLNAIIGFADLLDMGLDGELTSGQRQHLSRIQVGSRHLLDLINDVLDLARADANKLDIDLRPVDLGGVIEEVVELLKGQAGEKQVELVMEPLDPGLPHVMADLQRLRQILTNLIGNALKFTDEGTVRVRCGVTEQGQVEVQVIDSGIGIDPEVLPLVFAEFYQAKGDLTREKGGTGLGLAISQRLARLMGGEIEAKSVIGEGSTFVLELPPAAAGSVLREDDVEQHAARMEQRAAPPRPRPERVAVVAFGDQQEALTELARQVNASVRLCWTTRADDVVDLAIRERAALVVLDVASAEGAAWRAAHALHNVPELAHTAILLLPSIPDTGREETSEGLDLGWVSLVPKPFSAAQLTRAVSSAAQGDAPRDADAGPFEVLVVDDDPDSRRVAAKFLEEAALRVREAPDGETALVEMHRQAPDVVVLDLMMPVLDGFGVLATMRADPALASVPVVVLTAKSLTEAERQFLARTAVRVLQKGQHRLADVAALVLRAAARAQVGASPVGGATPATGSG